MDAKYVWLVPLNDNPLSPSLHPKDDSVIFQWMFIYIHRRRHPADTCYLWEIWLDRCYISCEIVYKCAKVLDDKLINESIGLSRSLQDPTSTMRRFVQSLRKCWETQLIPKTLSSAKIFIRFIRDKLDSFDRFEQWGTAVLGRFSATFSRFIGIGFSQMMCIHFWKIIDWFAHLYCKVQLTICIKLTDSRCLHSLLTLVQLTNNELIWNACARLTFKIN